MLVPGHGTRHYLFLESLRLCHDPRPQCVTLIWRSCDDSGVAMITHLATFADGAGHGAGSRAKYPPPSPPAVTSRERRGDSATITRRINHQESALDMLDRNPSIGYLVHLPSQSSRRHDIIYDNEALPVVDICTNITESP